METLLIIVTLIGFISMFFAFFMFVYKPVNDMTNQLSNVLKEFDRLDETLKAHKKEFMTLSSSVTSLEKRIDQIFVVEKPQNSPNDLEPEDEGIEFSENRPIDLPKDLKVEIEGGDSFKPPNYTQDGRN